MISFKKDSWFIVLLKAIICFGVIAAFINFIHNRSLWFDESLLALNIVDKSYYELLKPLSYNQVAPIGFLFIEKFIAGLLRYHDWSLRILPFISYLASMPLLYLLNKKLHGSKEIALIAVALFSINSNIIYYSFEVKQYSTDVFTAILMVYIGLKILEGVDKKDLFIYSIVGVLAIFLSNIAIVLILINAVAILYKRVLIRNEKDYKSIIPVLCWIATFVVYFYLFIYHHPSKRTMLRYWTQKDAFLPLNIFDTHFYQFLFQKIKMIFTTIIINNGIGWLYFVFFVLGLFAIAKKRLYAYFLMMPVLLHLLLSGIKLYPFHTRLILYLIPFFVTGIAIGLHSLYKYFLLQNKRWSIVAIVPLLISICSLGGAIPFEKEEVKQCMDYIQQDKENYETIYLYCSSIPVFKFYLKKYPGIINNKQLVYGDWHRENWNEHLNELAKIKGDAWLIFSEVYMSNGKSEADFIVNMLKSKGYSVIITKKFTGAICCKISIKK